MKVATPTFSPGGGTYSAFQTVTISSATAGATIHYTTSGQEPSESDPAIASGGTLLVDHTLTLKAKSLATGLDPQRCQQRGLYDQRWPDRNRCNAHLQPIRKDPLHSADCYDQLRHARGHDPLHHQWAHANGKRPCDCFLISSGSSLLIDHSLTLKAKAWRSGWTPSGVRSATFTIGPDGGDGGPNE